MSKLLLVGNVLLNLKKTVTKKTKIIIFKYLVSMNKVKTHTKKVCYQNLWSFTDPEPGYYLDDYLNSLHMSYQNSPRSGEMKINLFGFHQGQLLNITGKRHF